MKQRWSGGKVDDLKSSKSLNVQDWLLGLEGLRWGERLGGSSREGKTVLKVVEMGLSRHQRTAVERV